MPEGKQLQIIKEVTCRDKSVETFAPIRESEWYWILCTCSSHLPDAQKSTTRFRETDACCLSIYILEGLIAHPFNA